MELNSKCEYSGTRINKKSILWVLFCSLVLHYNVANTCELVGRDIFNCLENENNPGCLDRTYGRENSTIGDDGNSVEIKMPKGSYTRSGFKKGLGTNGGAQVLREILPRDEVTINFSTLFNKGFEANKGGKFGIGIGSGNCPTGGSDSNEGSSVRLMWRAGNEGEVYFYGPDKKTKFGISIGRGNFKITPGIEQKYELKVKMNDIGKENGILELYVDGKLVISREDIVFRTKDGEQFGTIISSTFFGGGKPSDAAPKISYIWYKDVCVE